MAVSRGTGGALVQTYERRKDCRIMLPPTTEKVSTKRNRAYLSSGKKPPIQTQKIKWNKGNPHQHLLRNSVQTDFKKVKAY